MDIAPSAPIEDVNNNEYDGHNETGMVRHDETNNVNEQASVPPAYGSEGNIVPGMADEKEVGLWLKSIDYDYFDEYYHCFVDHGFDKERVIKTMSIDDLK